MCFLLALGNRPQGAKWFYTMAFIGFAVITLYMTVRGVFTSSWLRRKVLTVRICGCGSQIGAFFLAFKGVENIAHSDGPLTFSDLFTNSIFRNIVISILATLGLYILASLIFVCFP